MFSNNPQIKSLLQSYKSRIADSHLKDEKYKWELISKFKGRPDTNAADFAAEYKGVKFGNLVYNLTVAVGNHICRENPEAFRKLFMYLFDETKLLNDRVNFFSEESLKIYRSFGGERSHHQDERTISAYLTFHYPEKYTFFKSTFYKEFCKLMGVEPAGKNEKYGHYLELLNQFIQEYIVPDTELIEKVKSYIPEYYDGSNHLLLAQDILYTMLDKKEDDQLNYKPQFTKWLQNQNLDGSNKSASYLRAIDLLQEKVDFIIYETSDSEILEDLYTDLIEHQRNNQAKYFNAKSPSYGNNGYYSAAIKSYIQFHDNLRLVSIDNLFEQFIQQFNADDFNLFMNFAQEIIQKHQLKIGDERLTFNYYDNKLVISVGQRYCLGLFNNDKKRKFAVLSKDPISEKGEEFDGENNKAFLNYLDDLKLTEDQKANITLGIKIELNRTNRSGYRKHNKLDFEKYVFEYINNNIMTKSLNQILYGPPGTGKTYNTKNLALSIVNPSYESKDRKQLNQEFENWSEKGNVSFITFHQSMSYEEFIEGIKPQTIDGNITYSIEIGLFQRMINRALYAYHSNQEENALKEYLSFDKVYEQFLAYLNDKLEAQTDEYFVPLKAKGYKLKILSIEGDGIWTIGSSANTEVKVEKEKLRAMYIKFKSVNDIKNVVVDIRGLNVSIGWHSNYFGIFQELKVFENKKNDKYEIKLPNQSISYNDDKKIEAFLNALPNKFDVVTKSQVDQFVIIIDEINRGNVSSIFGELITLIEEEKRLGNSEELFLTLTYSKSKFIVPSNLHIIGTMNTADRSVEALDTALRRRFSFVEMLPKPELLKEKGENGSGKVGEVELDVLLRTINDRIEALVDRDHTIGHAFFMEVNSLESLRTVFANNVIPLLQEYFYGDYAKMEMVIGPDFFNKDKRNKKVTFAVQNEDVEIENGCYELINIMNPDFDFESALIRLLNIK